MSKTNDRPQPRLGRELARIRQELNGEAPNKRATPIDALQLATRKWIDGERVEVGAIADELGVARATMFRWVGSRELLLGEVIWSLCVALWDDSLRRARGTGADYVADLAHLVMDGILGTEPLRRFLDEDQEYALRILTSKTSIVQSRIVAETCKVLRNQHAAGHIAPTLEIESLAYLIVRVVESFVYSDHISGRKPDIDIAREAIRILVAAKSADGPNPVSHLRRRRTK